MNVVGMVCPRTGIFYALESSHVDKEILQYFLDSAQDANDGPERPNQSRLPPASG